MNDVTNLDEFRQKTLIYVQENPDFIVEGSHLVTVRVITGICRYCKEEIAPLDAVFDFEPIDPILHTAYLQMISQIYIHRIPVGQHAKCVEAAVLTSHEKKKFQRVNGEGKPVSLWSKLRAWLRRRLFTIKSGDLNEK